MRGASVAQAKHASLWIGFAFPPSLASGDTPLNSTAPRIGILAAVILIGLRLTIGLHFFTEGWRKVADPKPFSAGFFTQAKGPLAPLYKAFLWDPDGKARLGFALTEDGKVGINYEATVRAWDEFLPRASRYYGFQAEHDALAQAKLKLRKEQLADFYKVNRPDVLEYFRGLERRDRALADPTIRSVESLWGQTMSLKQDLAGQRGPWLAEIETIWDGLEYDMFLLGGKQRGPLEMSRPGRTLLDTESLDQIVPYFDMAIGLCLILGLFTRTASILGALFLGSIVLTQWPWAVDASPTWAQSVEMFGLLVLAALSAGRFCGVDSVLSQWAAVRGERRAANAQVAATAA